MIFHLVTTFFKCFRKVTIVPQFLFLKKMPTFLMSWPPIGNGGMTTAAFPLEDHALLSISLVHRHENCIKYPRIYNEVLIELQWYYTVVLIKHVPFLTINKPRVSFEISNLKFNFVTSFCTLKNEATFYWIW